MSEQDERQGAVQPARPSNGPVRSQSSTFDISEYTDEQASAVATAAPPRKERRQQPAASAPTPQPASGAAGSRGNPVRLAKDVPAATSAAVAGNGWRPLPGARAVGRAQTAVPAAPRAVAQRGQGSDVAPVANSPRPAPASSPASAAITAPVTAVGQNPLARFWNGLGPTRIYVAVMLVVLLFLGLHFAANKVQDTAGNILQRAVNGDTPKVDKYAYLGHPGEVPGQPSYLLTANVSGNLGLIEAPGGNWGDGKIYQGPPLLGDGADQTAVQIVIQDINCDGKPDVGEQIGNKIIYYLNNGSTLEPLKTAADVANAMAACPTPTPTAVKGGTK